MMALVLILSAALPSIAFADDVSTQETLRAQYENTFRHARYLMALPYGLAKREVLPYGLAKRDVLPKGLIRNLNEAAFVEYVESVIAAFDGEITVRLAALIDDEPLDVQAILDLLAELFADEDDEEDFAQWAREQAVSFGATEEQLLALEAFLDNETIDQDAVLAWLDELEEAFDLASRIAEVREQLALYGDEDDELVIAIEALLDAESIDWELVEEKLEALIYASDLYLKALTAYEAYVEAIDALLDAEDFEWPDLDTEGDSVTGDSFHLTYDPLKGWVDPTLAELEEANGILEQLLAYLGGETVYTIAEGLVMLDELADDLQELVDTLDFGEKKGQYTLALLESLEVTIDAIADLDSPEIFDIMGLKGTAEDLLSDYEQMRHITPSEKLDFLEKKIEVREDYGDMTLEGELAELYALIDNYELDYEDLVPAYTVFLDLYADFMALVPAE